MTHKKNGNGLNATKIIEAIQTRKGFISMAARDLGVSRMTIYRYMEQHPTIKQAVTEERELLKDIVENKLLDKIENGDTIALIFFLKTQGKDRGYIERQELSGPEGAPIPFSEVVVNIKRDGQPIEPMED